MKAIYQNCIQSSSSRAAVLNVCITRRVKNIDGWERLTLSHPFLVSMCEVIIYGNSEYEMYNEGWSVEDKRNAQAHLNPLVSFEFVYALVSNPTTFSPIFEGSCCEIARTKPRHSFGCCPGRTVFFRNKNYVDDYAHRILEHNCRIAERSQIAVTMPRVSLQQQHRPNQPSNSIEEYFKTFSDHSLS